MPRVRWEMTSEFLGKKRSFGIPTICTGALHIVLADTRVVFMQLPRVRNKQGCPPGRANWMGAVSDYNCFVSDSPHVRAKIFSANFSRFKLATSR